MIDATRVSSMEELHSLRARYRDKTIALATGCFDLLHVGHLIYLREAAAQVAVLVVGVNSDASIRQMKGPSRPLIPEGQRLQLVAALRCVDHALVYDDVVANDVIRQLRPDVFVAGADSAPYFPSESRMAVSIGARVHLVSRQEPGSTTELLARARLLG